MRAYHVVTVAVPLPNASVDINIHVDPASGLPNTMCVCVYIRTIFTRDST